MNWARAIVGASLAIAGPMAVILPVFAQMTTFKSYRCEDGTQFIVAFYPGDSRAHMQIDGREVTLAKRLAVSGAHYSGDGVRLQITGVGATMIKHVKRPLTACEPM